MGEQAQTGASPPSAGRQAATARNRRRTFRERIAPNRPTATVQRCERASARRARRGRSRRDQGSGLVRPSRAPSRKANRDGERLLLGVGRARSRQGFERALDRQRDIAEARRASDRWRAGGAALGGYSDSRSCAPEGPSATTCSRAMPSCGSSACLANADADGGWQRARRHTPRPPIRLRTASRVRGVEAGSPT